MLESQGDCVAAEIYLGRAAQRLGDLPSAHQALLRATVLAPDNPDAQENLGIVLAELHRRDDAAAAFNRAIELAPARPSAWANLATLEMSRGKLEEAARLYRKVRTMAPDQPTVCMNLCWILRRLGSFSEAVEAGRRAVELAPANLVAQNYLIFALLANDECHSALQVCDRSLRLNPRNTTALAHKPAALEGLGRRQEGQALMDFDRLLSQRELDAVPGFRDVSEFNDALEAHVLERPTRPFDETQTVDIVLNPSGPIVALKSIINDAIESYLKSLPPDSQHPFLGSRPRRWQLDGWGTRLCSMHNQEHHFHQHGWVSGVYYVRVPEAVGSDETGMAGCIEFCQFAQYSNRRVESDFAVVRPEEGLMVLFPSYFYHRVLPFDNPDIRISIAFNATSLD